MVKPVDVVVLVNDEPTRKKKFKHVTSYFGFILYFETKYNNIRFNGINMSRY